MNETENKRRFGAFLNRIKSDKKSRIIILVVIFSLLAAFLLLVGTPKKTTAAVKSDDYVETLEKKLSSVLGKINGAGKVAVMITVESGMETVLAKKTSVTETNGRKVTEETPLIVGGKTVTLKENYPKIIGVLIIAEGAGNITVMRKIQDATLSVLDVSLKQVEILSMN